jgi:hypothetical protein
MDKEVSQSYQHSPGIFLVWISWWYSNASEDHYLLLLHLIIFCSFYSVQYNSTDLPPFRSNLLLFLVCGVRLSPIVFVSHRPSFRSFQSTVSCILFFLSFQAFLSSSLHIFLLLPWFLLSRILPFLLFHPFTTCLPSLPIHPIVFYWLHAFRVSDLAYLVLV